MFIIICWKRGRVFTAVAIMVSLSWKTSFQLSNDLFVEYSSFHSITKRHSRGFEKLFQLSFRNFEKVELIIKLNSVKSKCQT